MDLSPFKIGLKADPRQHQDSEITNDVTLSRNAGSLTNLLRMLDYAERIANEDNYDDINEDQGLPCWETSKEFDDMYHGGEDVEFTPSIFDELMINPTTKISPVLSHIITPPSSTRSSFPTSSKVQDVISGEDAFEPTPLGPSIHVVPEVPLWTLLQQKPQNESISMVSTGCIQDTSECTHKPNVNTTLAFPSHETKQSGPTTRKFQEDQWKHRFDELIQFKKQHGHVLVPHGYPKNRKLSQWVKRQRYQYRLKQVGRHNTLTDDRQRMLEEVGFVWDSHQASWNDHFQNLEAFYQCFGHVQIPSKDNAAYAALSTWCKHQRRQYRNYMQGCGSTTMNPDRIRKLESIGFEWNPRHIGSRI